MLKKKRLKGLRKRKKIAKYRQKGLSYREIGRLMKLSHTAIMKLHKSGNLYPQK